MKSVVIFIQRTNVCISEHSFALTVRKRSKFHLRVSYVLSKIKQQEQFQFIFWLRHILTLQTYICTYIVNIKIEYGSGVIFHCDIKIEKDTDIKMKYNLEL